MTTFYIDLNDAGSRKYLYKGPDDKQVINLDWTKWLGSSAIDSVAWEADSGITLSNASLSSPVATNYVSSGVKGCDYDIRCTITTDDAVARTETRTIQVRVVEKR